jgi:tetratricopeptide (TPR) repeat protein
MTCHPLKKLKELARNAAWRSGLPAIGYPCVSMLLGITLPAYYWWLDNTLRDGLTMLDHGARLDISHDIGINAQGSGPDGKPTRKEVLARVQFDNTSMITKEKHGIESVAAQKNKQATGMKAEVLFRETHRLEHARAEKLARDIHAALESQHPQRLGEDEHLDVVTSEIALARLMMEQLKFDKAQAILERLVACGPRQSENRPLELLRHSELVMQLAQALSRQGKFADAASELTAALAELKASQRTATNPTTYAVRMELGSTLVQLDRASEAEAHLKEVYDYRLNQLRPNCIPDKDGLKEITNLRARALYAQGKRVETESLLMENKAPLPFQAEVLARVRTCAVPSAAVELAHHYPQHRSDMPSCLSAAREHGNSESRVGGTSHASHSR